MKPWTRLLRVAGGRRVLFGLGVALLVLAIVNPIVRASEGTRPATVLIQFLLVAGPAFALLFGSIRLPRTDLHPDFYATVAAWALGTPVVTLGLIVLYDLQPDIGLVNPYAAVPALLALSCLAGFGAGIYDARAQTRERELNERNEELQCAQRELEETVEQVRESNERLEQFAHAVSHDLQEPLRMVSSYLQLIESDAEEELTEDTREYLEFAVDGADRMRTMIDGLLAYSRVETEAEPLEPVDLNEVLADVRDDLQLRIDQQDAELVVEDLPTVLGDESQLRQVFQNLLDNAIEYSGDEPPRVRVAAEPVSEASRPASTPTVGRRPGASAASDYWSVTVSDEGIGMTAEDAERIFEVFERLHSREEHAGTGIGLAICKRVIERHGGEIWVESEPGEGSTFYMTLPDARDGAAERDARRSDERREP